MQHREEQSAYPATLVDGSPISPFESMHPIIESCPAATAAEARDGSRRMTLRWGLLHLSADAGANDLRT